MIDLIQPLIASLGSSSVRDLAASYGRDLLSGTLNLALSGTAPSLFGNLGGYAFGLTLSRGKDIKGAIDGIKTANLILKAAKLGNSMGDATSAMKYAKTMKLTNMANLGSIGLSVAGGFIPEKEEYSGKKGGVTLMLDMGTQLAELTPGPIGWAAAAGNFLGKGINALGGGTSGHTLQDAILGSNIGTLATLGINGFFGNTTNNIEKDLDTFDSIGSSYMGTNNLVDDAVSRQGKYGLFSSGAFHRANRIINEANKQQNRAWYIALDADLSKQKQDTMIQELQANVNRQLQGGLLFAKEGGKIETWTPTPWGDVTEKFKEGGTLEWSPQEWTDEEPWIPQEWDSVDFLKEGGKMNVIPEGALHARLHHMDLDGITKKGIPVITEEDGKVIQHAEIELNEIVFNLEVTKKIEELSKKFYDYEYSQKEKDEVAIEAGKLLAKEIIENTDDRTGLIDTVYEN